MQKPGLVSRHASRLYVIRWVGAGLLSLSVGGKIDR